MKVSSLEIKFQSSSLSGLFNIKLLMAISKMSESSFCCMNSYTSTAI